MFDSRDEYQPFGYLGRIPLYVTTLLVLVYSVFLVVSVLLFAGRVMNLPEYLAYGSDLVIHRYQFWRLITYALVNEPGLWFVIDMYLLYSFGREVERFIGRSAFAMLYATLVILAPCLLTAAGLWCESVLKGSWTADFAIFIAFATIYPDAEIFFTFKAKWIAAVLLGINTLAYLKYQMVTELLLLWATSLCAFLFIKYLRGHIHFRFSLRDYLRRRRSRSVLRPVPDSRPLPPRKKSLPPPSEDVIESIDPLLDKIARHGIASLTQREREQLEHAREELLKKPSSR